MTIPELIGDVRVYRAWPGVSSEDYVVEGRDATGAVRAGQVRITSDVVEGQLPPTQVDPALPELADVPGELIAHRAGKRAVLRDGEQFFKVVRRKKAVELVDRNTCGAELAGSAGILAASPKLESGAMLVTRRLPGNSLSQPGPDWEIAWQAWAERWPDFVAHRPAGLPSHSPQQEAQVLTNWLSEAIARGLLPDSAGSARTAAGRISERLVAQEPELLLSHRDLHDGQLLFSQRGNQLSLLDFDTLALAEPALDLGNLSVHAILRVAQGVWRREHADAVLHAVMSVAGRLLVSPQRLQLAQAATALRLAAVYSYRPKWNAFASRWLQTWLTKPVLC